MDTTMPIQDVLDNTRKVNDLEEKLRKQRVELALAQLRCLGNGDFHPVKHRSLIEQLVMDLADTHSIVRQMADSEGYMKLAVEGIEKIYTPIVNHTEDGSGTTMQFWIVRDGTKLYLITMSNVSDTWNITAELTKLPAFAQS